MLAEPNPYSPPRSNSNEKGVRHIWRHRQITISAGALASRLWLIIGYTITIDGQQRFYTAQWSATEDFRWTFQHDERTVEGHFATFGIQNGIRRKYHLSIDGEPLGPSEVPITGWWGVYIVWPGSLLLIGSLVYWYSRT